MTNAGITVSASGKRQNSQWYRKGDVIPKYVGPSTHLYTFSGTTLQVWNILDWSLARSFSVSEVGTGDNQPIFSFSRCFHTCRSTTAYRHSYI
jgi:hypothetical protein